MDPATGAVVTDAAPFLPEFSATVKRDVLPVPEAGDGVQWSAPMRPGDRFILQYVCTGSGALEVSAYGGTMPVGAVLVCGEGFAGKELTAELPELSVQISRPFPRQGELEVALQLIALP
ncbi:hypothetical protein BDK92_3296 [Micromonospora pisi]|uniref:Uncharacterized protein n=1 Tax=Micromonospora pisi TaxID=589240 RepID=A0A495JKU0_9ACTN|nr:hypothetical protein BDK92_3296 [Micromonospora pisi]